MTRKIYKSAQGKDVDLGALLLQNEQVRAVGNMNVNARGDRLDAFNQVIDQKNQQVTRQYQKQVTNMAYNTPVHSSNLAARKAAGTQPAVQQPDPVPVETVDNSDDDMLSPMDVPLELPAVVVTAPTPVDETTIPTPVSADPIDVSADPASITRAPPGGLAAAIAISKVNKQEKENTARQMAQSQPLKRI